ncbi:hypothetical protein AVEN_148045-1 [Araneus ventricosus]|uniref:Uncharacterized protein n=1 Tax=Araneus ventricosus TaxID=182803 RepID=A0A4Y2VMP1_ARAVE|nr:hypothetical protein AVEN_112327-1 [Araneus ventricosus]GBO26560.1 hypothetical protein AVEN_205166-1 [Araneus ventricosus]GBO26568.1 hypothetical protein AVEN_148045-1 [Araneus ventricosus]
MDVTQLKTQRKALRTSFTIFAKSIEDELMKEAPNVNQLSISKAQIEDKFTRLEKCQTEITNLILKDTDAERAYEEDFLSAEKYRDRFSELCAQIQRLSMKETEIKEFSEKRKFKLPKIELKKFTGDAKEYLSFWSQFRKIHEDTSIPNEDKMQYLLQAVVPKTKAARVVESFPVSNCLWIAENYPKAIAQLKERFGRDDLLVQIYVRDLLSMVMKNAASGRTKTDLPALYDELEAKIRALESLGRTQEKYGDFLSPLVESCLPEEILVAWERSRNMKDVSQIEDRSLEKLMNFLKQEVKGEEMVELARTGFSSPANQKKKEAANKLDNYPTAATLVSTNIRNNTGKRNLLCIFCNKKYPSKNCLEARNMSIDEKKKCILKNRACFCCFSVTHFSKFCKVKNSCLYCAKPLHYLMCDHPKDSIKKKSDIIETNSLSNSCSKNNVFLMTLIVKVCAEKDKVIQVRTLLDSVSQYSYISKHSIEKLGIKSNNKIKMQHMLFGGRETQSQIHDVYELLLSSMDESYSLRVQVFSGDKICGTVPKVSNPTVINELSKKGIILSDFANEDCEIGLLLGEDVAGMLFMEGSVKLDSGLFLLKTRLGFVLTGKQEISDKCNERCDTVLNVISLFVKDSSINELWSLENIGIFDPIQRLNENNEHLKVRNLKTV